MKEPSPAPPCKAGRGTRIALPGDLKGYLAESVHIGVWLSELQSDFPSIKIEVEQPKVHDLAKDSIEKESKRLIELGHKMVRRPSDQQTLHESPDAYRIAIEKKLGWQT